MRLLELRKNKGVYQREVADYLGIASTTYLTYERGSREPSLKMLDKLAEYFNVSVDYLMGRVDEPQLFDNARVQKSEIQQVYDELNPNQQENVLTYARALKAMNDDAADAFPSRRRA